MELAGFSLIKWPTPGGSWEKSLLSNTSLNRLQCIFVQHSVAIELLWDTNLIFMVSEGKKRLKSFCFEIFSTESSEDI